MPFLSDLSVDVASDGPMPHQLKVFLWVVAGFGGAAGLMTSLYVLWRRAHVAAVAVYKFCDSTRKVVHLLLYELQPNSGGSLKDQARAAARAAAENKTDIDAIRRDVNLLAEGQRLLTEGQQATHGALGSLRSEVARLAGHTSDNNLQGSQFLADEKALQARVKERGPIAGVPGSPYGSPPPEQDEP
jgi:hypothetical protein